MLALYFGGMGARGKNFYNDVLKRYGYVRRRSRFRRPTSVATARGPQPWCRRSWSPACPWWATPAT